MPVETAAKVVALSEDFGSRRRLAELLEVDPAQVTRWARGGGIDDRNAERGEFLDLDDPAVLRRERLRPSHVATRNREVTQPWALRLHDAHPDIGALPWWSTLEASWQNVTVFDRAARALKLLRTQQLTVDHPVVREAADVLGLRVR